MKFALLSFAAAAAIAIGAGSASAHPPSGIYRPSGGHLDYHNGHYHYHNGYYRSGPLVPAYPAYNYPRYYGYGYNSGFGLTVTRPGFNFSVGNGVTPYYAPYGYYRRW